MKIALILAYNEWGWVRKSIQYIKSAGLVPLIVGNKECAEYNDLVSKRFILRSDYVNKDHASLIAQLERHIASLVPGRWSIELICNYADRMWLCYLDLRRRYPKAAGPLPTAIACCANKANLRFVTRNTNLAVRYCVVSEDYRDNPLDYRPLRELAQSASSVIVKPIFGIAGEAVTRVMRKDGGEKLSQAIVRALEAQRAVYGRGIGADTFGVSAEMPVGAYALVEEYIDGTEYSVEGFATADGELQYLLIQRKTIQEQNPVFRDLEYVIMDERVKGVVAEAVTGLLNVTGYKNGPFHIELKKGINGVKPIEFNPRIGGGSIIESVNILNGIDLHGHSLAALRSEVRLGRRVYLTSVIQPKLSMPHRVVRYKGIEELEQQHDVVFVRCLVAPGTEVINLNREVYLIEFCVVGRTFREVKARAADLSAKIEVVSKKLSDKRKLPLQPDR